MAKRIRCRCGNIFDPGESGKCPSCGAEVVATAVPASMPTVTPGPPPLPLEDGAKLKQDGGNDQGGAWQGKKRPLWIPLAAVAMVLVAVMATGAVVAVKYVEPVWRQYFGGGGGKKSDDLDKVNKDKKPDTTDNHDKVVEKEKNKDKPVQEDKAAEKDKAVVVQNDQAEKDKVVVPKEDAVEKPAKEKEKEKPSEEAVVVSNDKKEDKKPEMKEGDGGSGTKSVEGDTASTDGDKKDKAKDKGAPGSGLKPAGEPGGDKEIHVAADAPPGGATLEEALAKSADGATIVLAPGTYKGGLVLSKPVHLIGDNKEGPVVIALEKGKACISAESPGITIENVRLEMGSPEGGSTGLGTMTLADEAAVTLVNCEITSHLKMGVLLRGNGCSLTASKCKFTKIPGKAVMIMQGKAAFTGCAFTGNTVCLIATQEGEEEIKMKSCTFQENGTKEGGGAFISLARSVHANLEQCSFTGNTAGLLANEQSKFTITGGKFSKNGVTSVPEGSDGGPLIGLLNESKGALKDCTFDDNRQGIAVQSAAKIEIVGCHFTGTGQSDAEGAFGFYCNPLSISGKNASAVVQHSSIRQSAILGVNVINGSSVTLEDTEVTESGGSGLGAGTFLGDDPVPCTVEIIGCKFNGCKQGIALSGYANVTIGDSETVGNENGLVAFDPDVHVILAKWTAKDNTGLGLWGYSNAQITATDSTIQGNPGGVQVGSAGDGEMKASMMLTSCTLGGNETFDASICVASELKLNKCTYGDDGKVKITREKGAVVKADPPLPPGSGGSSKEMADNDDPPPAVKKSSSGKRSSSSDDTPRRKILHPPTPGDVIRKTIDQVERLKRIFK